MSTGQPPHTASGKPFSPAASTDSGISPDAEGQISNSIPISEANLNLDNQTDETSLGPAIEAAGPPNALSADKAAEINPRSSSGPFLFQNLSSIFSPRPSPVTSPNQLPPLKEELKIIEENHIAASRFQTKLSSSSFDGSAPAASVFTFSKQSVSKEQKPKRKRKFAHRSRGPRPKTAALASGIQGRNFPNSGNQSSKMSSLSGEKLTQTDKTEVNKPYCPLQTTQNNSQTAALARPLTVGGHQRSLNYQPNSNADESYAKTRLSTSEINFNNPPMFLSQLNKKASLYPSLDHLQTSNDPRGSTSTQSQIHETSLASSTSIYDPPSFESSEFSRGTSIIATPNESIPAHSIEEAFESRNPRAFTIHRRHRLSPISNKLRPGFSNSSRDNGWH